MIRIVCRKNEFHDSMVLMKINEAVRQMDGVLRVAVLMATNNNKELLRDYGFWSGEIREAESSDLILAVEGVNEQTVDNAYERVEQLFAERVHARRKKRSFKTQTAALHALREANLALISVPGPFAALEAKKALKKDLHVFLFSDNVPLEEEISLKKMAAERGLLVMGPDCGTAIIRGAGLGFANRVRRGEIGIVGASGTGIQAISTQIHRLGQGISHALGTGSRDLSGEVGGSSMLAGIDLLLKDPDTRVIVLVAKPSHPQVADRILRHAAEGEKPFVIHFLGISATVKTRGKCHFVETLEEAAQTAVMLTDGRKMESSPGEVHIHPGLREKDTLLRPTQKYLRGIFAGGTLAYESMCILHPMLGPVYSNIPLEPECRLINARESKGHTVVDMGEDEFTRGRAHPMIDLGLLVQRLQKEASDPEVACVLLDCILGLAVHPDPAAILASAIRECKAKARQEGRHLFFVLSVCGTEEDPQVLSLQENKLKEAGAILLQSNAQAARFAGQICRIGR